MKKAIFTQIDPENFDYKVYYNEEDAKNDNIWLGGNKYLIEFNSDLRLRVIDAIDNINDSIVSHRFYKTDAIHEFMIKRINGKPYNKNDVTKICKLASNFYTCASESENIIICELLKMIYGKEFICGTIYGWSPDEWLDYIAPKEFENKIKYIETVLFNKGTEFLDEYCSCWFSANTSADKIKEDLAEQAGLDKESILLKLINKKHCTFVYDYEEA